MLTAIELQITKLNPRKILKSPNNRAANFSNDDEDGNENVKKGKNNKNNNSTIKLAKQPCTRVHHAFLYIFLMSLQD